MRVWWTGSKNLELEFRLLERIWRALGGNADDGRGDDCSLSCFLEWRTGRRCTGGITCTVDSMTKDQTSYMPGLSDSDKLSRRWGLGWRIRDRASSTFGDLTSDETFGHEGATGTVVWMDPVTDLSCVFFTNDPEGARSLRPRVANALCSALH